MANSPRIRRREDRIAKTKKDERLANVLLGIGIVLSLGVIFGLVYASQFFIPAPS